jgi:hypothetical protein
VLANTVGDTWSVFGEMEGHIFIKHGWGDFGENNMIERGDTLFFTYIIASSLEVVIFE